MTAATVQPVLTRGECAPCTFVGIPAPPDTESDDAGRYRERSHVGSSAPPVARSPWKDVSVGHCAFVAHELFLTTVCISALPVLFAGKEGIHAPRAEKTLDGERDMGFLLSRHPKRRYLCK